MNLKETKMSSDFFAVYLVESSKGLVSLQRPPINSTNIVIVTLGPIADIEVVVPFEARVIKCRSSETTDVNNCVREILFITKAVPMVLIATDDTFNIISYRIYHSFNNVKPQLILFDHLKAAGLSYVKKFKLRTIIRFRHILLKYHSDFVPIVHSNGCIGYKLNLAFEKKIYFNGFESYRAPIKITACKAIILIPLVDSNKYTEYLTCMEGILSSVTESSHKELISNIAIKLHPRSSQKDIIELSKYNFISRCIVLDSKIPLELFDLTGKIVLNFDSSFDNYTNADVLLLAKYFGYSDLAISNMTGKIAKDLLDVEQMIIKFVNNV